MERFARTIIGYHGCLNEFPGALLQGRVSIAGWKPSQKKWDWLGDGIYFFEHSPERALRWAQERYGDQADVLGALVQLGRCFDLLDESITSLLGERYEELRLAYNARGEPLPQNRKGRGKRHELDLLVVNDCLDRLKTEGIQYDTVRGAFLEGTPVYPEASFSRETHIQIAVRNSACILGVFRPNFEL
jgi:hypothetical protein